MNIQEKQLTSSEKEKNTVSYEKRFKVDDLKMFYIVEQAYDAGGWEFFSVLERLPFLQERIFSHVSHRLLSKYEYWNAKGEIRLTFFVDLLVQAREIVIDSKKYPSYPSSLFRGIVVFPNNIKDEIVIAPNRSGKLTIKLTTDA